MPDLAANLATDTATAIWIGARERQEDAVIAHATPRGEADVVVLSDGMGGHDAGDVASQIIVAEVLGRMFCAAGHPGRLSEKGPETLLAAVDGANDSLRDHARIARPQDGMGGTVVSTLITGGALRWVSVGDSPLFLYRRGKLWRLNADHSLAPQIDLMAAQGELDADAARTHPDRGVLTSALTGNRIAKVDCPTEPLPLRDGDIVLVASDGIQALSDADLTRLLRRNRNCDARVIADRLMAAVQARRAEDQDNVSVAVTRISAVAAPAAARPHPGLLGLLAGLRPGPRRAQEVSTT